MIFTQYQNRVYILLLEGHKLKVIAEKLGLSEAGVKYHCTAIYAAFGVKNRYELFKGASSANIEIRQFGRRSIKATGVVE